MPAFYDVRESMVQVTSTATTDVHTLSPPTHGPTTGCLISVDTTDDRLTFDGSAPSGTAGHLVKSAQAYPWYVPFGVAIKFCSTASANSVLNVTWLFN